MRWVVHNSRVVHPVSSSPHSAGRGLRTCESCLLREVPLGTDEKNDQKIQLFTAIHQTNKPPGTRAAFAPTSSLCVQGVRDGLIGFRSSRMSARRRPAQADRIIIIRSHSQQHASNVECRFTGSRRSDAPHLGASSKERGEVSVHGSHVELSQPARSSLRHQRSPAPVRSACICKQGRIKSVRLINLDSLLAFIENQCGTAETSTELQESE